MLLDEKKLLKLTKVPTVDAHVALGAYHLVGEPFRLVHPRVVEKAFGQAKVDQLHRLVVQAEHEVLRFDVPGIERQKVKMIIGKRQVRLSAGNDSSSSSSAAAAAAPVHWCANLPVNVVNVVEVAQPLDGLHPEDEHRAQLEAVAGALLEQLGQVSAEALHDDALQPADGSAEEELREAGVLPQLQVDLRLRVQLVVAEGGHLDGHRPAVVQVGAQANLAEGAGADWLVHAEAIVDDGVLQKVARGGGGGGSSGGGCSDHDCSLLEVDGARGASDRWSQGLGRSCL